MPIITFTVDTILIKLALAAYLKLDQKTFFRNDFSNSSSYRLTGTIYSDKAQTSAFNLTGYTLTIRLYKDWKNTDYLNKTATINSASGGTWYYNVAANDIGFSGIYLCKIELSQAGQQISTQNRTEVYIKEGAAA